MGMIRELDWTLWMPACNGGEVKPYFLRRWHPTADCYARDKAGKLRRFKTYASAKRAADKENHGATRAG